MIVYRSHHERMDVQATLAAERQRLAAQPTAEDLLAVFIEFGALETGVSDALMDHADELSPVTARLRCAALALAHAYLLSAAGGADAHATEAARRAHAAVAELHLPREIQTVVPEGYAYYGLHPLAYAAAAARFAGDRAGRAVCIGLRSIGSSLSAVVAAALQDRGWTVSSCTLRPRGHPRDRRPALGPLLAGALRTSRDMVLVVDEGPGLSGSSFGGVADALNALGVADERIVFFPSRDPPADQLRSAAARARWPHARKVVAEEHLPGFLAGARDLSAGAWRDELLDAGHEHPAVHPQHERRKFLVHADDGLRLYRFAGLSHYGAAKRERCAALADAGFGPGPGDVHEGYLDYAFLAGRPLAPHDASRELLDTMAHYLAFLARRFALPRSAPHHATATMLVENAGELLGDPFGERAAKLALQPATADAPAVALDGRMLPHEWLLTPHGFRKVDALDHHADPFFPGCNDIAWDLAAATEEFALAPEAADVLTARYAELSGDRGVAARLPFQRAAYLAHRFAYATLASHTLSGTPDGERFAALRVRYGERLREALAP